MKNTINGSKVGIISYLKKGTINCLGYGVLIGQAVNAKEAFKN